MSLNSFCLVPKIRAVKVERLKKMSVLVLNRTFFSIVQLWRLVFLEPVGVQRHFEKPHFPYSELLRLDLTHLWQNYIHLHSGFLGVRNLAKYLETVCFQTAVKVTVASGLSPLGTQSWKLNDLFQFSVIEKSRASEGGKIEFLKSKMIKT